MVLLLIIPCLASYGGESQFHFLGGLYAKGSAAQIRRMLRRLCIFQSFAKTSAGLILEKGVLARGGLCFLWQKGSATRCFFCIAGQLVHVFVGHLDLGYVVSPYDYQLLLQRILSKIGNHVECFALARLSS